MEHIRTWEVPGEFKLELFDTGKVDRMGKCRLAYELYDAVWADTTVDEGWGDPIFKSEDFCVSPLHSIDGDETVVSLLGFLSLKAGDTDAEYFEDYTEDQIEWRDARAEELQLVVFEMEETLRMKALLGTKQIRVQR